MVHNFGGYRLNKALYAFIFLIFSSSYVFSQNSDLGRLHDRAYAVNENVICYQLVNKVFYKPKKFLKTDQIKIISTDDKNFKVGIIPEKYSIWGRPFRYSARPHSEYYKGQYVFLYLKNGLKKGAKYSIFFSTKHVYQLGKRNKFSKKNRIKAPVLEFKYGGDEVRSSSISVNQIGYLPNARKIGYVTQYAGVFDGDKKKLADVDFGKFESFSVRNLKTNKVSYKGKLTLSPKCIGKDNKAIADSLTQARVWEYEFTDLKEPGVYEVLVQGVGKSYTFAISEKIYNQVYGVLARGVFHQRCGTALTPEWTRHSHPACHVDDGIIPDTILYKKDSLDFFEQQVGKVCKAARGHHDAGDFGKYTYNGSLFASYILLPFEVMPEKLMFDASPVPEYNNKKADLLEEVKWELDWLSSMQDPTDGGVHIIVKPSHKYYEENVSGAKKFSQRRLWWKDIHVTASLASTFARAARTEAFVKLYPEESKQYLKQAKKAWEFCMENADDPHDPDDNLIKGHHYGLEGGALNEYLWMATELWLTTGEKKYHDYLLKSDIDTIIKNSSRWSWWPLFESWGFILNGYVYGKREGKDPTVYKKFKDAVISSADAGVNMQKDWAHRCSFANAAFRYKSWGWYFVADVATYHMLLASTIVDEDKAKAYHEAAYFNADNELGNNPDNFVSITGLGHKRIVDHVHQNSRFDGIIEPVPGIPNGFFPAKPTSADRSAPMWDFTHGEQPVSYRYVDAWTVAQEFTVPNHATTLMTYAMMSRNDQQKSGKPSLKLSVNGKSQVKGVAPFKVNFKADAKGASGKSIREYCWDIGNEDFASDKSFNYTFKKPGMYKIACSVTDEDGWMSYGYVNVLVKQKDLPNRGNVFEKTEDTVGLWQFDGNLNNEIEGGLSIKSNEGAFKFSDENLMWMASESGKAVQFTSPGEALIIEFKKNIMNDATVEYVEVEAIMCYEQDYLDGFGHSWNFILKNKHLPFFGRYNENWSAPKTVMENKDDEAKKLRDLKVLTEKVAPQPGWYKLSYKIDKVNNVSSISIDDKIVAQTAVVNKVGEHSYHTTLHIGGFKGKIDNLRIQMKVKK